MAKNNIPEDDAPDTSTPGGPAPMSLETLTAVVAAAVKAANERPEAPTMTLDAMTAIVVAAVKTATEGSAELHATAMQKALKPENAFPPAVSAFNPAGDRDHPRPALKCEFTLFDGIPIDGVTDTVEEIELLNQLHHGEYLVDRSDGSKMPFKVREIRNDMGVLRKIDLSFPYRDDADRAAVLPMRVWLKDIVAQQAAAITAGAR